MAKDSKSQAEQAFVHHAAEAKRRGARWLRPWTAVELWVALGAGLALVGWAVRFVVMR